MESEEDNIKSKQASKKDRTLPSMPTQSPVQSSSWLASVALKLSRVHELASEHREYSIQQCPASRRTQIA